MFVTPPVLDTRPYALFISHAWHYGAEYDRLVELLNSDVGFKWRNLSVPEDDPLPPLASLPKSHRHLVRKLDERIKEADCVLVLAGMYVAYSGWIQSEIEAAKEFGKPIIAVEPRGQERFPDAVKQAADETVGWTRASVIGAVRKYALGQHTSPFAAMAPSSGHNLSDLLKDPALAATGPSSGYSLADLLKDPAFVATAPSSGYSLANLLKDRAAPDPVTTFRGALGLSPAPPQPEDGLKSALDYYSLFGLPPEK